MFQFPGFASPTYEFSWRYRRSGGLPHSETHGSKPARGSPWLIAACCVLRRLSVPRHPPDALHSLDLASLTCAARRRQPAGAGRPPEAHPFGCITDPTARPPSPAGPTGRVVLGHKFSSPVKDPPPASAGIPVPSRGYRGAPAAPPPLLVEADGIEPTASCLQSTRSPN